MAKACFTSIGVIQGGFVLQFHHGNVADHEVRDAHSVFHRQVFAGAVVQHYFHFATIVCIYGSGAVEDGEAVFVSQAAAGAHLRFMSRRHSDGDDRVPVDSDAIDA